MEASSARRRGRYLDFSRLSPPEYLGMAAALVLLVSLWLPWFTTSAENPDSAITGADVESEVSHEQAWPADEKIVAEELGPFLRSLDESA